MCVLLCYIEGVCLYLEYKVYTSEDMGAFCLILFSITKDFQLVIIITIIIIIIIIFGMTYNYSHLAFPSQENALSFLWNSKNSGVPMAL